VLCPRTRKRTGPANRHSEGIRPNLPACWGERRISTSVPKGREDFCLNPCNEPGPWVEIMVRCTNTSDSAHVFPSAVQHSLILFHPSTRWGMTGCKGRAGRGGTGISLCSRGQAGFVPGAGSVLPASQQKGESQTVLGNYITSLNCWFGPLLADLTVESCCTGLETWFSVPAVFCAFESNVGIQTRTAFFCYIDKHL